MKKYYTLTENGAIQLGTSGNACLDLFSKIGNMREFSEEDILRYFHKAFVEDPIRAVAILFWVRAVRTGSGERRIFEVILNDLMGSYPKFVIDNVNYITEVGSFKDLSKIYKMNSVNEEIKEAIQEVFANSIKANNKLAMKWLPRKSELYSKVNHKIGLTHKEFRKLINGHTVETEICKKNFKDINYSHVPSLALNKYKKLFMSKDEERFMDTINKGEINSSTLYPYQIVQDVLDNLEAYWVVNGGYKVKSEDNMKISDTQWNNLPSYNIKDTLVVVDTSGSMSTSVFKNITALSISISLGIYAAEHTDGPWKGKIISFSESPKLVSIDINQNIGRKVIDVINSCMGYNTNLRKVFKVILNEAIQKNIKQEDMPKNILLVSDMQFDDGVESNMTLIKSIKDEYESKGYSLPHVIYWNTSKYQNGVPIEDNNIGTMVSGFSANLFKDIANNPNFSAREVMDSILKEYINKINYSNLNITIDPYVKNIVENINNPHETRVDINNNDGILNLFQK